MKETNGLTTKKNPAIGFFFFLEDGIYAQAQLVKEDQVGYLEPKGHFGKLYESLLRDRPMEAMFANGSYTHLSRGKVCYDADKGIHELYVPASIMLDFDTKKEIYSEFGIEEEGLRIIESHALLGHYSFRERYLHLVANSIKGFSDFKNPKDSLRFSFDYEKALFWYINQNEEFPKELKTGDDLSGLDLTFVGSAIRLGYFDLKKSAELFRILPYLELPGVGKVHLSARFTKKNRYFLFFCGEIIKKHKGLKSAYFPYLCEDFSCEPSIKDDHLLLCPSDLGLEGDRPLSSYRLDVYRLLEGLLTLAHSPLSGPKALTPILYVPNGYRYLRIAKEIEGEEGRILASSKISSFLRKYGIALSSLVIKPIKEVGDPVLEGLGK